LRLIKTYATLLLKVSNCSRCLSRH